MPRGVVSHLLAPLAIQSDDLQHLPDVLLRHPPERLDDAQVLLPGEVAVVAGALDETPHLPQHSQAVAAVHFLPQHPDIPRRGVHRPRIIFSVVDFPAPLGPRKP